MNSLSTATTRLVSFWRRYAECRSMQNKFIIKGDNEFTYTANADFRLLAQLNQVIFTVHKLVLFGKDAFYQSVY